MQSVHGDLARLGPYLPGSGARRRVAPRAMDVTASRTAKAHAIYNAELEASGLQIQTPQSIRDVTKQEVPLWVQRLGGHAVVQSLMGNFSWSSVERAGRYYHVGTIPDRHGHVYVADLRIMVCGGANGFRPLAIYARRSRKSLPSGLEDGESSWDVLGTNLSERQPDGAWTASTERLLLMDRRDFNTVGVGTDDLVEAYVQSVLATIAVDKMTARPLTQERLKWTRQRSRAILEPWPRNRPVGSSLSRATGLCNRSWRGSSRRSGTS